MRQALLAGVLVLAPAFADPAPRDGGDGRPYFTIQVVVDENGSGVPLIELRTVNALRCPPEAATASWPQASGADGDRTSTSTSPVPATFTPADGFGQRGHAARHGPRRGGRAEGRRINIADSVLPSSHRRGIYADSILTGVKAPLKAPVLNGRVLGSDCGTQRGPSRKILLVLGRFRPPSLPAGQLQRAGGGFQLPAHGGLKPEPGVDLDYFLDAKGFAKETAPDARQGADVADGADGPLPTPTAVNDCTPLTSRWSRR